MKPTVKKILIIIALGMGILSFIPIKYIQSYDYEKGHHLKGWVLREADTFTVRFTHSVARTPVYEIYVINESNEIFLSETFFSSYGAGNPETTPYDFEITEKGFRIYNINQKLDPLVYRTGAIIANHTLILNEKEIPFLHFSKPSTAVGFAIQSRPLIVFLFEEVLSWILKMTI